MSWNASHHLDRVDLGEAGPVVAVVELAQLGEELLLPLLRIPNTEVREPLRQHLDVLCGRVDEQPRQLRHVVVRELADGAEVDEPDRTSLLEHEDVGWVRIAVEETVTEDHRHPGLGDQVGQIAAFVERERRHVDVAHVGAVEPLQGEHPRARVLPVDLRHVHMRIRREVPVERLRVARLEPVVELLPDLARELVDQRASVNEVERMHALLHEPRRLVQQRQVGLDLARRARPLHLHGDLPPVRKRRTVHLADRRRCDRLPLEVEEEPVESVTEILLDHALGLLERERAHVVLKAAQLGDDVGRHDVRSRREQLAELDESRPELVEQLAQMLAARGADARLRRRKPRLRRAAREEVRELVRLEEVAEAVADHHLCDLRQASQAARRRLLGHVRQCDTSLRSRFAHGPGGTRSCSTWR